MYRFTGPHGDNEFHSNHGCGQWRARAIAARCVAGFLSRLPTGQAYGSVRGFRGGRADGGAVTFRRTSVRLAPPPGWPPGGRLARETARSPAPWPARAPREAAALSAQAGLSATRALAQSPGGKITGGCHRSGPDRATGACGFQRQIARRNARRCTIYIAFTVGPSDITLPSWLKAHAEHTHTGRQKMCLGVCVCSVCVSFKTNAKASMRRAECPAAMHLLPAACLGSALRARPSRAHAAACILP